MGPENLRSRKRAECSKDEWVYGTAFERDETAQTVKKNGGRCYTVGPSIQPYGVISPVKEAKVIGDDLTTQQKIRKGLIAVREAIYFDVFGF